MCAELTDAGSKERNTAVNIAVSFREMHRIDGYVDLLPQLGACALCPRFHHDTTADNQKEPQ
jgi:hypothetical protein